MGKTIKHPQWTCREGCGRTGGCSCRKSICGLPAVIQRLGKSCWAVGRSHAGGIKRHYCLDLARTAYDTCRINACLCV